MPFTFKPHPVKAAWLTGMATAIVFPEVHSHGHTYCIADLVLFLASLSTFALLHFRPVAEHTQAILYGALGIGISLILLMSIGMYQNTLPLLFGWVPLICFCGCTLAALGCRRSSEEHTLPMCAPPGYFVLGSVPSQRTGLPSSTGISADSQSPAPSQSYRTPVAPSVSTSDVVNNMAGPSSYYSGSSRDSTDPLFGVKSTVKSNWPQDTRNFFPESCQGA